MPPKKQLTRKPNIVANQMAEFFNLPPVPVDEPEPIVADEPEPIVADEPDSVNFHGQLTPEPILEPEQPVRTETILAEPEQKTIVAEPEQKTIVAEPEQKSKKVFYSRTRANHTTYYYDDGSVETHKTS